MSLKQPFGVLSSVINYGILYSKEYGGDQRRCEKKRDLCRDVSVRCGRGVRRLKMDLNEGGVGAVAGKIYRGYKATFLGKLDFASPTEYKTTDF